MPPTRRSVLGSIGSSGAAAIGLASTTRTVAGQVPDELDIEIIEGPERDRVIDRIPRSNEVKILYQKVAADADLVEEPDDALVTRATTSDSTSLAAVIPFVDRSRNRRKDMYLVWNSSTESDTRIHDLTAEYQTVTYSLEEDKSTTNSVSTEVHEWDESQAADCVCECPAYSCESYNWGCILSTASAVGTVIGTCASCVSAPNPPTCTLCLAAITGTAGISIQCDIGDNCTQETKCVQDETNCSKQAGCTY